MSGAELQKQSGHCLVAPPDLAASHGPPEDALTSAPALQERKNLTAICESACVQSTKEEG